MLDAVLDAAVDRNREYIKRVDERVTGRMRRLEDWKAKVERELDAADADIKHLHTMVEALQEERQAREDLPW